MNYRRDTLCLMLLIIFVGIPIAVIGQQLWHFLH